MNARKGGAVRVHFRLSDDTHETLNRLAEREGGNRSEALRRIVREAAAREEIETEELNVVR